VIGSELVRLHSAYQQALRPCHHLNWRGDPIDGPRDKPGVMLWAGRPHPATHDLLGKPRQLTGEETSGWMGPDDEHWLIGTLTAAATLTGDEAAQVILAQQARVFLWAETLPSEKPGWYTSGRRSARSVGYACYNAVLLYDALADRDLAERVRDRVVRRIREVYVPQLRDKDYWDVRVDDPRLGPGAWWIPWQQALGAFGLYVASKEFGEDEGVHVAHSGAWRVCADAWKLDGARWVSSPQQPVSGAMSWDASFNYFGMCLAPWVCQDHVGTAADLWQWLVANATEAKQTAWLPPEGA
jgi:hypothetical protein